jgi:tetratricopeptide (TPR) repeat protein
MPSEVETPNMPTPALAYAKLLTTMHQLIAAGKGDSEEAECLAEQMDAPWYAMTEQEQERMRGLAGDLNALLEGGSKRLDMNQEELDAWKREAREAWILCETGQVDETLAFLRKPYPSDVPPQCIPFLQARCWEKLGYLESALVFMKAADTLDSSQALSILLLLQRLGRLEESKEYADRVIDSPASPPLELYLAAVALLQQTRTMTDAGATPCLQRVLSVLDKALKQYLALSQEARKENPPTLDAEIAQAKALVLERLGRRAAAIDALTKAIEVHPHHSELLMARGLALYERDLKKALGDLKKAADLDVPAIWPYLLLARHFLRQGSYHEALRFALLAECKPGPPSGQAEVYETIAIAQALLGQPRDGVLENLDRALALDPGNARICKNRSIAQDFPNKIRETANQGPASLLPDRASEADVIRYYNNRIDGKALLYEERRSSRNLALVN